MKIFKWNNVNSIALCHFILCSLLDRGFPSDVQFFHKILIEILLIPIGGMMIYFQDGWFRFGPRNSSFFCRTTIWWKFRPSFNLSCNDSTVLQLRLLSCALNDWKIGRNFFRLTGKKLEVTGFSQGTYSIPDAFPLLHINSVF